MKGKIAAPNEMLVPIIGPMSRPGALCLGVYRGGQSVPLPERPTESIQNLCKHFSQEGGVNLNLLLHSSGGLVAAMKFYQTLIGSIKDHGGVVRAYVPVRAASAAAVLWSMADERNLTDTTTIMFHCQATPQISVLANLLLLKDDGTFLPAQICKRTEVPLEEERENDRSTVRNFLLKGLRRDLRTQVQATLQRAFDDPKNPRDELNFKASDLAAWGKARTFRTQKELRARFFIDTGIHVSTTQDVKAAWARTENLAQL